MPKPALFCLIHYASNRTEKQFKTIMTFIVDTFIIFTLHVSCTTEDIYPVDAHSLVPFKIPQLLFVIKIHATSSVIVCHLDLYLSKRFMIIKHLGYSVDLIYMIVNTN